MKTCPQCNGIFDEQGTRFCPHDGTALVALGPGARIAGRYELIEELGHGGMGVVFLAKHIPMDRQCALKLVRGDAIGDPAIAARLLREAKTAISIMHPNVVTVYDAGETEGGVPFIVMEYVAGQTLAEVLEDAGVLLPRFAARIVWQTANALTAAHRLEIVHRDIKPANIMITQYGDWDDFVKVVDFGIAKAYGSEATSQLTSTGRLVGTPAYMSPEQLLGRDLDHRTDLYSLGLVTIRMLAGALPLDWPMVGATGTEVVDALPTSTWPEDVKSVLATSLAAEPGDRFDTVTEFASEFVGAVERWVPRTSAVREPWDARVSGSGTQSLVPDDAARHAPSGETSATRLVSRWVWAGTALGVLLFAAWGMGNLTQRPAGNEVARTTNSSEAGASDVAAPSIDATIDSIASLGTQLPEPEPRPEILPPIDQVQTESPPAVRDQVARLRDLIDLDQPDRDSIRAAVVLAGLLLSGELSDSARVEVLYRRGEANIFLGDGAAACADLRALLPAADSLDFYARSARALQQSSCR